MYTISILLFIFIKQTIYFLTQQQQQQQQQLKSWWIKKNHPTLKLPSRSNDSESFHLIRSTITWWYSMLLLFDPNLFM